MGPDHGVTSLDRAQYRPSQTRSACAPGGPTRGGGHRFPRLPSIQTGQSRNAWWRCHVISFPSPPSRAFQGRRVSPPSSALPLPPLACRSRVGGRSRLVGIPPQSAAFKEGGRRGEEGKERGEGGEGNQRLVAAAAALCFPPRSRIPPFFGRNASKSFLCTPPPLLAIPRSIRGSPGPPSLWEGVWGFISLAELHSRVSDMHSSSFKPQEGLRVYFGGRSPGFNT